MKKIFFLTVFFLAIAGIASAQTKRMSRHRNTNAVAATPTQTETRETENVKNSGTTNPPVIAVEPDNRKEYMQDGQLATYTGHEATPVNSDQFQSIKKDRQDKKEDQ